MRVLLGPEQATSEPAVREQVSTVQVHTDAPPRTEEHVPLGTSALTVWSETVLAPLVNTIREQAEQIGSLRTERDALAAELESEKRSHSPVAPDLTPAPTVSTVDARMWATRRIAWLLVLAAGGVLLFGLLMAWPR